MVWNNQPQQSGGSAPVSVLLAHRDMSVTTAWYQALQVDTRFRVTSMANTQQDLIAKLASSPEVILLDGAMFNLPASLTKALTSITGAVYLIVPGGNGVENLIEQFKAIPCVKSVSVGDVNIADFTTRAYENALALRRTIPAVSSGGVWNGGGQRGGGIGGLRIVTIWSRSGGTGRTTIAIALAQAAGTARDEDSPDWAWIA